MMTCKVTNKNSHTSSPLCTLFFWISKSHTGYCPKRKLCLKKVSDQKTYTEIVNLWHCGFWITKYQTVEKQVLKSRGSKKKKKSTIIKLLVELAKQAQNYMENKKNPNHFYIIFQTLYNTKAISSISPSRAQVSESKRGNRAGCMTYTWKSEDAVSRKCFCKYDA